MLAGWGLGGGEGWVGEAVQLAFENLVDAASHFYVAPPNCRMTTPSKPNPSMVASVGRQWPGRGNRGEGAEKKVQERNGGVEKRNLENETGSGESESMG